MPVALQGTIYNSFEDNEVSYKLKEEKINSTTNLYSGQIGYKKEKDFIYFKFKVENQTNTLYNKTRYIYCMSTDDVSEYNINIITDSMSEEPDSDIFPCYYFPKTKYIIPISDVFNSIFSSAKITLLDRDYSR